MKNPILLYLEAIHFEFEQEKIYHSAFKIKGFVKFLPRSIIFFTKFHRFLIILNIIYIPGLFAWVLLVNPLLSFYFFIRWMFPVLVSQKCSLPKNVYFSLSDIKFLTYIDNTEKYYPENVIIFPFHSSKSKFKSAITPISFIKVTGIYCLLKAIICSLITPCILLFKYPRLQFFSYSSFYWYWVYFTFQNEKFTSVWISNHYDRWIKLVDSMCTTENRIIVQHGQLEYKSEEEGDIYMPDFSSKLTNIQTVYAINEESIRYFRTFIISPSIQFILVKSKLNILKWPNASINCLQILIIGHEYEFIFQNELITYLLKHPNRPYQVAFKPHPQQTSIPDLKEVWVITEPNQIPDGNVVVSYGSSLDHEIKSMLEDVTFVVYGLNEKRDPVDTITRIERDLRKILSKNGS